MGDSLYFFQAFNRCCAWQLSKLHLLKATEIHLKDSRNSKQDLFFFFFFLKHNWAVSVALTNHTITLTVAEPKMLLWPILESTNICFVVTDWGLISKNTLQGSFLDPQEKTKPISQSNACYKILIDFVQYS